MPELTLPSTVVRRNKLDISLGYCNDLEPNRLLSLGPAIEVALDDPEQVVDFLLNEAEDDRAYFVNHLPTMGKEWEYVCFARHGSWHIFDSRASVGWGERAVKLCPGPFRRYNWISRLCGVARSWCFLAGAGAR